MAANKLTAELFRICAWFEEDVDVAPVMSAKQLKVLLSQAKTDDEFHSFMSSLAKSIKVGAVEVTDVM